MVEKLSKDERELKVLKDTIEMGKKKQNLTKKISHKLDGNIKKCECPDFFIRNDDTLYGVEHFHVDGASFMFKNDESNIQSAYRKVESRITGVLQKKVKNGVLSNDVLDDIVLSDLPQITEDFINESTNHLYPTFLKTFFRNFDDHFDNIDDYFKTLDCNNNSKLNTDLVFLIEINDVFSNLYELTNNNPLDYKKSNQKFYFFLDLAYYLIKKMETTGLSYIIFSTYTGGKLADVIALDAKDIGSSIRKQNRKIYVYDGLSLGLEPYKKDYHFSALWSKDSDSNFTLTVDVDCMSALIDILIHRCNILTLLIRHSFHLPDDYPIVFDDAVRLLIDHYNEGDYPLLAYRKLLYDLREELSSVENP